LEHQILRFKPRLFQNVLGLTLCVLHHLLGLLVQFSLPGGCYASPHEFIGSRADESAQKSAQEIDND
jgi:hypothetical protein